LISRKFYQLLGLCAKAGKLRSGSEAVVSLVRKGQAKLVLIAEDASENTRTLLEDKSRYYKVQVIYAGSRDVMSKSIGKMNRTAIAILDDGFAKSLLKMLDSGAESTQST
jgi:ribosomal protein L7Ae-like RNA K-turn-binding protein